MHEAKTFDELELSRYTTITRLSARGLVSLTRALQAVCPEQPKAQVQRELLLVKTELEGLERALAGRHRGAWEQLLLAEVAFDQFLDGLWVSLDARLGAWAAYERPGIQSLIADEDNPVDYDALAKKAERARELSAKLFGAEGLAFTRSKFEEQSTAMATLIKIIKEDGLGEELDELAGAGLLESIYDCQGRYEAMVSARASREQRRVVNVRELMVSLRARLQMYVITVLSTLDRERPESLQEVQGSLRPILSFRRRARMRAGAGAESVEELEAELEALAAGESEDVDEDINDDGE